MRSTFSRIYKENKRKEKRNRKKRNRRGSRFNLFV